MPACAGMTKNSRLISSRIPDAELIMLKNSGHGFFLDAVEEVNREVMGFLKRSRISEYDNDRT